MHKWHFFNIGPSHQHTRKNLKIYISDENESVTRGALTLSSTTRNQLETKRSESRERTRGASRDVSRRVRAEPQQLWSSSAPHRRMECTGFCCRSASAYTMLKLWYTTCRQSQHYIRSDIKTYHCTLQSIYIRGAISLAP